MIDQKVKRLEFAREALGLSKGDFAASMGIISQYYSQILAGKGKGNLRIEHLEELLKNKGVNPYWVLSGNGSMLVHENADTWVEQSFLPDEIGPGPVDEERVAKLVGGIIASVGVPILYSDLSYHLLVRACRQYIGRNPDAVPDTQDIIAVTAAFAAMLEAFHSLLDSAFELSGQSRVSVVFEGTHYTFRKAED